MLWKNSRVSSMIALWSASTMTQAALWSVKAGLRVNPVAV